MTNTIEHKLFVGIVSFVSCAILMGAMLYTLERKEPLHCYSDIETITFINNGG